VGRTWRQTGTLLGHNHFVSALSLDEDLRLVIASCDLFFVVSALSLSWRKQNLVTANWDLLFFILFFTGR
jgi:hypothetical protein